MSWRVIHGDCIEAMRAMEPASVDAVVTDPPYGLEFMGKAWDKLGDQRQPRDLVANESPHRRTSTGSGVSYGGLASYGADPAKVGRRMQEWHEAWAREALRVLKPGGHLLAFGGTRTYHRLTCAIEDAGFEVRDCIAWMYGSGFPKSLDVGKAIDKAAGAEREIVGLKSSNRPNVIGQEPGGSMGGGPITERVATAPATPDAVRWDGWGTALKPAFEPIVVARKPLDGTVAQTVVRHGTGALNVDGCRVEGAGGGGSREGEESAERRYVGNGSTSFAATPGPRGGDAAGRWPANVVLDPEAAAVLDEQTGELTSGTAVGGLHRRSSKTSNCYGRFEGERDEGDVCYGDTGGASRFFYVAKADSAERNAGLVVTTLFTPPDAPTRNDHPTVKPIALMRWLVRLVTPPGGLVLDPFAGSGSTGCAAALGGFDFVGVEQDEASVRIARARLAYWSNGGSEA